MGKLRQLRLLLWKNFLLQIRRPIGTAIEFILPIAAAAFMIVIRQVIKPNDRCFRSCTDVDLHYKTSRFNFDNSSAPVVGFYPDTPLTRRIMETAGCMSSGMYVDYPAYEINATSPPKFIGQPFRTRGYNSSSLLEQEASVDLNLTDVLGAVVFDGLEDTSLTRLPLNIKYAIRLRPKASGGRNRNGASWRTNQQEPGFERTGLARYVLYDVTFAPLQYIVDQAIVRAQVEDGGQCVLNTSFECPDVSAVTTTCSLKPQATPSAFPITVQFKSGDPDFMMATGQVTEPDTGMTRSFDCACNRSSALTGGMRLFSASCDCSEPWNVTCKSDGPVDLGCCGRCGDPATSKKTFLPVVTKNFPYPKYRDDTFLQIAGFMISLLLVLALIYPAGMFVRELVLEKQTRMRETMKMMGLSSSMNYMSWFIKQLIVWSIVSAFISIIIVGGEVFPKSNGFFLFLFLLCYFVSAILFLFMLSTLFSDPRVAMISTFALWFITYVPYLSVSNRYDDLDTSSKSALCLICINGALGMGMFQYSRREIATEGVQFSNAAKGLAVEDDFTIAHVIGMMFLNDVIYILIIWYWSNVFPGEFGIPRPFYFFLQKSYWLGSEEDDDAAIEDGEVAGSENHEEEPVGVSVGISIRNLRKVYHTGGKSKVAVENLDLNMYSGQITALLGHNGAGKTTTMSMLVGLFPPTSGDAFINNHSVRTDIDKIRTSLGLCPQHNVLYDVLTVREHLRFFLELKTGRRGAEADKEIADMITDLQLEDKTDWKARELSGGMKRKLSVAIALIGGSKVVILDEPSSGMDPYARRATWDLLLKHKEGRTILLTTHFMDEADLLGDRIAIMASGQLVCSGSSLFLKTRFGVGYHLVVVKDSEQPNSGKDLLVKTVTSHITNSRMVGDIGAEMSFVLPHEGAPNFRALFSDLEDNSAMYGISSFGVSVTTMEEVFHRVGETVDITLESKLERRNSVVKRQYSQLSYDREEHEPTEARPDPGRESFTVDGMDMSSNLLQGTALWLQQFRGMFMKRYLTSIRHPLAMTLQLLFPVILTICALLIIKLVPANPTDPALNLAFANLKSTRAYTADFRDGAAKLIQSPLDSSSPGRNYLDIPSLIQPQDISADSLRFQPQNGTQDCCLPNFITSPYCIRKRYEEVTFYKGQGSLGVFASCGSSFGFKDCSSCLNARTIVDGKLRLTDQNSAAEFSGRCEDSNQCPAVPTTASAERRTTWFQARVLEGSNTGAYFKTWQSGYSLHSRDDDLPDAIRNDIRIPSPNCYQTILDASCSNTTSTNCTSYVASPACLSTAYDPDNYGMYARVWYSAKAIHTLPYAINTWSNMHLRNTLDNASYTITAANDPLPKTVQDQADSVTSSGNSFSFGIIATLGMAFLTASFAFNPVEEKQSKSKHIQFVSGVHISVYWMANYAWDLVNYLIPLIMLLIVYAAFNIDAFQGSNYAAVFVLLLMFGWCGIPFAYLWSFLFNNPLVAYGSIAFFQFIMGLVYLVVIFIFNITDSISAASTLAARRFFYTLPHYSLAQGLTDIFNNFETRTICDNLPLSTDLAAGSAASRGGRGFQSREFCYERQKVRTNIFDWEEPGVGKEVFYMAIGGCVYFILTMLVEKFLRTSFRSQTERPSNLQSTNGEDSDVAAERRRIESLANPSDSGDMIIMKNLTKSYGGSKLGRPSADNLCLGIPSGECFGLLGVNGAGKTTTFNMLSGDVQASYGSAYLSGFDVRSQLREVQQRIGYCPQFDALCEKLTAYELLSMYARLRGIPEARISPLVDQAIKELNLTKWADRQCGTYSGGNKRKLGAAVALVGDPPIVFLDEPTSGMDPGARRFLWDVLINVMRAGRSIVLTSHSMEECEALCTRLAIMVNGQFKCLGSIQHLKSKFGQGYTIMLKVDVPANVVVAPGLTVVPDTGRVEEFIAQSFPGAELLESHHGQMQYQVSGGGGLRLSEIFGRLQQNKEALNIVDYSVSQTSLEQVFLNFARTQFTKDGDELLSRQRSASFARSPSHQAASPTRSASATETPVREAKLPRSVSPANIVTRDQTEAELV